MIDKGRELVFDQKRIRGKANAPVWSAAPFISEHFMNFSPPSIDLTTTTSGYFVQGTATGSTATTFVPTFTSLGGALVMTMVATAGDGASLFSALLLECDTTAVGGNMFVEARIKTDRVDPTLFFGFSDNAAAESNNVSYAITVTDSTFTTTAPSDAVGFLISGDVTGGDLDSTTTTVFGGVATKGDTDTLFVPGRTAGYPGNNTGTAATSGLTFTSSTYYTLRVELNATGDATLFVNNNFFASKPAAVTTTVPLGLNLNWIGRATATGVTTIDYLAMGGTTGN